MDGTYLAACDRGGVGEFCIPVHAQLTNGRNFIRQVREWCLFGALFVSTLSACPGMIDG
jgi:hypothetical protein